MNVEAELAQARAALQAGNPGRARVCARRAAGGAIREWYRRRAQAARLPWQGDALTQLRRLMADPNAPAPAREAAERLNTKVDLNHELPFDTDPVEDARAIIRCMTSD